MRTYLTAALFAAFTLSASAQTLYTSYFSESYVYRHRLNPAFDNYDNYFAMPLLGNVGVDASMNVGVGDFLFKGPRGKLVTFMHPSVSTDQFVNGLASDGNNRLTQEADLTILSWGGHTMGGFTTFEVGLHEFAGFSLPTDLFSFLKEMNPDHTYQFSDARLQASSWLDVSLGHSHEVLPGLRLGFKAKALLGVGYADAHFTDFSARLSSQEWRLKLQGEAQVAAGGHFERDEEGRVSGYEDNSFRLNGIGAALDLGVVYDFGDHVPSLRLSAAVNNFGFLEWLNVAHAVNNGEEFCYRGFQDATIHDEPNHQYQGGGHYTGSLSDQWGDISDDLDRVVNLQVGNDIDYHETLAPILNLGIEYQPSRFLSLGVLYSRRFSDIFAYQEARANLTFKLSRYFHVALSGAATTYGTMAGASINLHAPGFNLFFGSDRIYLGSVNSDYIPLDPGSANVQFGLTFPFDRRRD